MIHSEKITEQPFAEQFLNDDSLLIIQNGEDDSGEPQEQLKRASFNAILTYLSKGSSVQSAFTAQYHDTRISLKSGMYYFEVASTSKAYIYKANGSQASSIGAIAAFLIIPDEGDYAKLIAIKKKPSVSSISDILSLLSSMDELFETSTISASNLKDGYLEATGGESIWCWEIGARQKTIYEVGSYVLKPLVAGITAEIKVSLIYPVEYDEFAVVLGSNETARANKDEAVRIAAEIMGADSTEIVFFSGGSEITRAKTKPTIKNCGMLFAEYEEE